MSKIIEKQFVSYGQAFKLKELGFKEECLASYGHAGKRLIIAPLKQQAIEFLINKMDGCQITYYGEGCGIVTFFELDPIPFNSVKHLINILIRQLKNEIRRS